MLLFDAMCLRIAREMINFFYFFGISRKSLAILWVVISSFSCALAGQLADGKFRLEYFSLVIWIFICCPYCLWDVRRSYREDDVLPRGLMYESAYYRVGLIVFYIAINAGDLAIELHNHIFPIGFILWSVYPYYYTYFFMNQNSKSRFRLKDLARLWRRQISTALRWRPAPQPMPQPAAHCISVGSL